MCKQDRFWAVVLASEKRKKNCKTSVISFISIYVIHWHNWDVWIAYFRHKKPFCQFRIESIAKRFQTHIMYVLIRSFRYISEMRTLSSSKLFYTQIKFSDLWIIHRHWYVWWWCSKKHKHFWYLECDTNGIKYWLKQKHSFRPQKLRFNRSALNSAFRSLQSLSEFFKTFFFKYNLSIGNFNSKRVHTYS